MLTVKTYIMTVVGIALMIATLVVATVAPSGEPLADSPAFETVAAAEGGGTCTTFKGKRTIHVCAPSRTPKGSPIVRIYEDGSAQYQNGSAYDHDDMVFTFNGKVA